MLDVFAPSDMIMYNYYRLWINAHAERRAPAWAEGVVLKAKKLDSSIRIFLVPCAQLIESEVDWNQTRFCQFNQVPCMLFTPRAIFYPMPNEVTNEEAWKYGLAHELAHLYPQNNSKHDDAFYQSLKTVCNSLQLVDAPFLHRGLQQQFKHIRGFLV